MDLRKDTLFFDALVDFPTYGQEDKLYLDKANGALYYWDGSAYALAGDGTGGVTSVTASSPLSSTEGATPNISITQANGSTNGYLSSTDWTTFNGKQNAITLTTTGTSGAATLVGSTLNIPQYAGGLSYFTEAQSTAAPNATVNVDSLTAAGSTTNVDIAIRPKGSGALLAQIPDNGLGGGNKRGTYAVDLCLGDRGNANQVASGAYSVIIGGRYNKALGQSSFATGESNSSNGNYSFSAGQSNTVNGSYSIGIGLGNSTANDFNAAIGSNNTCTTEYYTYAFGHGNAISSRGQAVGYANTCSGLNSNSFGKSNISSAAGATSIGDTNTANGQYSLALGFRSHVFGVYGRQTYASGNESTDGDAQASKFILRERTTGNTATTITSDSNAAGTANQVILSNNSAYAFEGKIIGKQSGSTNAAVWKVEGLIVRGANAASTVLTASTITLFSNLPGWGTPTLAADTTNGGLRVQVTGLAATNIQWTAIIETTEVIYA